MRVPERIQDLAASGSSRESVSSPVPGSRVDLVEGVEAEVHDKSPPSLRTGRSTDCVGCCGTAAAGACARVDCGGGYALAMGCCSQSWAIGASCHPKDGR